MQGWGHSPAAEATLVLSGSSWANAAAGTPGASSTDSPIDKQGSAGKRLGKQRKGGLSMFLSGAALETYKLACKILFLLGRQR